MGLSSISFLLFLPFFSMDIGTFMNIEHDTALLHMSTYIAKRWHRARGLCMCWGGEAPIVRNSTTTTTHTHLFPSARRIFVPDLPSLDGRSSLARASFSTRFKATNMYFQDALKTF